MFKLNCNGYSDKGPVKSVNEDAFMFRVDNSDDLTCGIFAVSDGVGGLSNGDFASSYIVTSLDKWWKTVFRLHRDDVELLKRSIVELLKEANTALIRYGKGKKAKCGATVSVLFIYRDRGYIFHVGDSRIYRVTKKMIGSEAAQLTVDHSKTVEIKTDKGVVRKSYLTECIGGRESFEMYCGEFEISKKEYYLLISDGVYKTQSENEFSKPLFKNHFDDSCRVIVENAAANGETDNITAVCVMIL